MAEIPIDASPDETTPVVPTGPAVTEPVLEAPDEEGKKKGPSLNKFFKAVIKLKVSDLHLKAGLPAMIRMKGDLRPLQGGPLTGQQIREGIFEVLTEKQKVLYEERGAVDFAYDVGPPGDADRFRVNAFQQRGQMSVAARRVSRDIRNFAELYLPESVEQVTHFHQGMALLAGITGSGKSTTIAAMIDHINKRDPVHIVTIEDPIEYLFTDKRAVINQREIGIDVGDFHDALKYLMREDPDIVLIGEMRDVETFKAAVHAAETGHLVFGTIHASSSSQTISRLLDLFPPDERRSVRQALEFNLKSIICQKLIPSVKEGVPLVPAVEIMYTNASIRKLIREERDNEIVDVIRASYDDGMVDFTEHLRRLVDSGYIDHATAYEAAPNPDELRMALKGIQGRRAAILG
ncbi:MAG: PilT/PilU family type 4a pilus ATPase [Phycisphaerae bacterium]|jgi:twitching motility protein PilT|nr:PilT/PilU family type 4a pilus ATPase [Phycisphaerae bacterium]